MRRAADAARAHGARSVHAIATHGVFAEGAEAALGGDALDSIIVTDTAGDVRARVPSLGDRLIVIESASLFADALGTD